MTLLRRGDRGAQVAAVQARLRGFGLELADADGELGLWTEAALYALQRRSGLVPDGLVGPATRARLDAEVPEGLAAAGPLVRCLEEVPYLTQRDNRHEPLATCNVTALAMALLSRGVRPRDASKQLEDELYEFLHSDAAVAYYRQNSPELFARHTPAHEVHDNLAWAATQHGVPASFSGKRTRAQIEAELAAGRPVLLSGAFTGSGHIVLLVGLTCDGDFIVHDPYGDWTTKYKDPSGAFRIYERDRTWDTLKELGSDDKWGLFLGT
jgi:hypothetical protein